MKKQDILVLLGIAIFVVALSGVGFALQQRLVTSAINESTLGSGVPGGPISGPGGTRFTSIPSNTSVTCGSSTQAVATSTARNYVTFVNDSANNIYLTEGVPASSTASIGIRLNANGGSYEVNGLNLYTGSLYCAANASSTLDEIVSQ